MSSPPPITSASAAPPFDRACLSGLLAPLETLPGVSTARAKLLSRIAGGTRMLDLLFCLPESVVDRRLRPTLAQLRPETIATVSGTVQD
ncbi:MAG: ATP-dependent DNA helicase RecG, partial [Acetobacter persici]